MTFFFFLNKFLDENFFFNNIYYKLSIKFLFQWILLFDDSETIFRKNHSYKMNILETTGTLKNFLITIQINIIYDTFLTINFETIHINYYFLSHKYRQYMMTKHVFYQRLQVIMNNFKSKNRKLYRRLITSCLCECHMWICQCSYKFHNTCVCVHKVY